MQLLFVVFEDDPTIVASACKMALVSWIGLWTAINKSKLGIVWSCREGWPASHTALGEHSEAVAEGEAICRGADFRKHP